MPTVRLETIDADNWREAVGVRVADDQVPFVADHQPVALVILAKCFVRPGGRRWEPLLVRDEGGAAIGVVALEHGHDGCELRHVAIDVESQRHGYGTAAVRAIVDRAGGPETDCTHLVVSAHPDNAAAHATYRAAGFEWDGERRADEPVWRRDIDRDPPIA